MVRRLDQWLEIVLVDLLDSLRIYLVETLLLGSIDTWIYLVASAFGSISGAARWQNPGRDVQLKVQAQVEGIMKIIENPWDMTRYVIWPAYEQFELFLLLLERLFWTKLKYQHSPNCPHLGHSSSTFISGEAF